jgi:hypothetical protein
VKATVTPLLQCVERCGDLMQLLDLSIPLFLLLLRRQPFKCSVERAGASWRGILIRFRSLIAYLSDYSGIQIRYNY